MGKSSWFHSVAVACLLIALAAVWPVSSSHPQFTAKPVAALPDADRARLDSQLDLLRAAGYRIGPTATQQMHRTATWWSRLWTVQAEDTYNGYGSITPLNQDDPNNYAVWAYSSGTGPNGTPMRMWGGARWDASQNVQTWGEGIVVGTNDGPVHRRVDHAACRSTQPSLWPSLTATVFARRDDCSMSTGDILVDSAEFATTRFWLAYPTCWGVGFGCMGAAWLTGFDVRMYTDVIWLLWYCAFYF